MGSARVQEVESSGIQMEDFAIAESLHCTL